MNPCGGGADAGQGGGNKVRSQEAAATPRARKSIWAPAPKRMRLPWRPSCSAARAREVSHAAGSEEDGASEVQAVGKDPPSEAADILTRLRRSEKSVLFNTTPIPVNVEGLVPHDYRAIIRSRMDLGTVKPEPHRAIILSLVNTLTLSIGNIHR